jgi:type I restriction enzyme S subunit
MIWEKVPMSKFLKHRDLRFKPKDKHIIDLRRIEKIDFSGNIITSTKPSNTDMILVKKGDLVISGINVEKGALAVYQGDEDLTATIHYSSYEFDKEKIDEEFLKSFLKSKEFIRAIKEQVPGGIKTEIKAKHLLPLEVQIPYHIEDQKRIVNALKKKNNKIEEILSQQAHQLYLLKELRQQILQDAVQGKFVQQDPNDEPASVLLARIKAEKEKLVQEKKIKKEQPLPPIKPEDIPFEIPANWRWCRLGEIGNFFRGKSKHRPRNDEKLFTDGKYPFVQTGDVAQSKYNNFLIETFSSCYNEVGLSQSKLWNKGTFCITIAANIAEVGFLNIDACVPDSVVTFSSVPDFSTKYLQYFFQTVKEDIEKFAPATAQKNINLGIIQELIFPLPPKNVQIEIVKKVENLWEICDKLEKTIKQNQKYTQDLLQVALKEALEPSPN